MNTCCVCNPRRDGTRICRDVRVNPETGELTCGTAHALAALLASHVDMDALGDRPEAEDADPAGFVRDARAAGWTIRPPTRRRAP